MFVDRIEEFVGRHIVRRDKVWFFALVALWLGLQGVALGPASYVPIHDNGDGNFPLHLGLARQFFEHGAGYWTPLAACGIDRLSDDLSTLHISALLALALPGWLAFAVFLLGHFFLSGYFTYLVARTQLKLSEPACVLAGATVAANQSFYIGYQWGFEAFTFVLWGLETVSALSAVPALASAVLLGAVYAVCSSTAASLPFCFPAFAVWFLVVRPKRDPRFWLLFCVFSAAALAPSVQTVWAMWVAAPASQRTVWAAPGVLELVALVFSFLRGMAMPLSVAIVGLVASRFKDHSILRLLILCAAILAAEPAFDFLRGAFGGGELLAGFHLRFYEFLMLLAALAAAFGLEHLPRKNLILGVFITFFAVDSMVGKVKDIRSWYYEGSYAANYQSPVLASLGRDQKQPFRVATTIFGLYPGFAQAYGLETADGHLSLYPKTYARFWEKVVEPVASRSPRLRALLAGASSHLYLFTDVPETESSLDFAAQARLNLLSLANVKYIISRIAVRDPRLTPILEQPLWFSLSRGTRAWIRIKENFLGRFYLYIYENKDYLPRAFVARDLETLGTDTEVYDRVAMTDVSALRDKVFTAAKPMRQNPRSESLRSGRATIDRYSPDRIEVSLSLDGAGVLVVSNSYSPFWKCFIDGSPREIFLADGAFWGVLIDKTSKKAVFVYEPPFQTARR